MKTFGRVFTACILCILIIGGLRVLADNKTAVETGVDVADRVQERLDRAKEKQENMVQRMRGRYLLNQESMEDTETQTTENEIRYSTDQEQDFTYDLQEDYAEQTYKYETGYIFMGDSRIYLMNRDCGIEQIPNFFVVCCPGMGYDWMMSKGFPQVSQIKLTHPEIKNWVLISGFGLNDIEHINDYVDTYSYLSQTMDIRLLSVNPTMGVSDPRYSNGNIEGFNQKLQAVTGVQYINCYDYLSKKGFWMIDNLHYNEQSNWDIYAFILDNLYINAGGTSIAGADSKDRAQQLSQRMSRSS